MMEEIVDVPRKVKDGSVLENDHGYPVGNCAECRFSQYKMYSLDGKWYCLSCFPKMIDLKNALKKLEVHECPNCGSDEIGYAGDNPVGVTECFKCGYLFNRPRG